MTPDFKIHVFYSTFHIFILKLLFKPITIANDEEVISIQNVGTVSKCMGTRHNKQILHHFAR